MPNLIWILFEAIQQRDGQNRGKFGRTLGESESKTEEKLKDDLLKPVKPAKRVNPNIFIINVALLIRKLNLGFYPTMTTNYVAFVPFPI